MSLPENVCLEDAPCPNGCNPNDRYVISGEDLLNHIPGKFSIVRCNGCGLERTNPRPTPETISIYYPSDYAPYLEQEQANGELEGSSALKKYFRTFFALDTRRLPLAPPGKMLEVGCSNGSYMQLASSMGWDVEGIEYSEDAAAKAIDKGFRVFSGSLESISINESRYDLIVAWMVIEHLHDPRGSLRKLNAWIKDNGKLVILVPDASSIMRKLFKEYSFDLQLPNHLYHYTPKSLETLLENSGWKVKSIFWQRNCNTLLQSLKLWAHAKNYKQIYKLSDWLATSKNANLLRKLLSIVLGICHQSGRIEVTAIPIK